MADERVRTVFNTVTFLRMAVIELRRVAEEDPTSAIQLRIIADKCESEIEELENVFVLPSFLPTFLPPNRLD